MATRKQGGGEMRSENKVSIKALVKYLSNYTPIAVDDISNPTCERILDIYWNLCCHIYGEEELLDSMRGKEGSKRLLLTLQLKSLLDRLLPARKPGFTVQDIVFPTKERTGIYLNALVNYLKVLDAQMHIRDKLSDEQRELQQEEDNLELAIVDVVEKVHIANANRDKNHKLCTELQDKYYTLEMSQNQCTAEVAEVQAEREEKKNIINNKKEEETELRLELRKVDERIEFLRINTLPPKAEFEEKLNGLRKKVSDLKEQCRSKKQRMNQLAEKIEDNKQGKAAVQDVATLFEESIALGAKNRLEMGECLDVIRTIQKAIIEVQTQIMDCKQEQERNSLAVSAESLSTEGRIAEVKRDTEQLQVVREDLTRTCGDFSQFISKLRASEHELETAKAEAKEAFEQMLETERAGWNHLEYLKKS